MQSKFINKLAKRLLRNGHAIRSDIKEDIRDSMMWDKKEKLNALIIDLICVRHHLDFWRSRL